MVLAFLIAVIVYVFFCLQHMLISTMGPSPNVQIPRFIIGESAAQFVALFALGIIFLAFDIRARDVRDRISGIIDAKPISNLELVVGRLSGIIILLCIPMLVFLGLAVLHGALAGLAGWGFGSPIEPWSVISFLVWDAIPHLAWWGGITMLLAVILRNRLLVVVVALGLYAFQTWIAFRVSWGHLELIGALTSQVIHPSDVAPIFVTGTIVLQRIGWLFLSIGLLMTTAIFLPRLIPRRQVFVWVVVGLFGMGISILWGLFHAYAGDLDQKQSWRQIHAEQDSSSFPDVQHLAGSVHIKPGNRLELDLSMIVSAPEENATNHVTFTLNPGYKIKNIFVDTDEIEDYSFQNGLLKIPANKFHTDSATLEIKAVGKPDQKFAYLDERINLKSANVLDLNVVMARFLGNRSYVFEPGYVALLPGVSWYPTSGVAIGGVDLRHHPRDHFTIDLTVTAPRNWHIAGPGKLDIQPDNKRKTTHRFQSDNPVVNIALIGAKFQRVSMTVQGTNFELLYSAKHRKTFAAMEPLLPQLTEWIEDRLSRVEQRYGLRYPYKTLTLVEVPAYLRVLGGGWSMDSTLFAPGVVMIRETGLPTARFDTKFKGQDGDQSFQELLAYVDNDLQGGNPFNGIAHNFVSYQTSPTGHGAIAMNYFIEDLVSDLIVERLPYYTTDTALSMLGAQQVAIASEQNTVSISVGVGISPTSGPTGRSGASVMRKQKTHNITNWTTIEQTSLGDLNFQDEPILSYDSVLLKNTYTLATLKDWMGDEALGRMLEAFLQQYRGTNYSYQDFLNFASTIEPQFIKISQNWIQAESLPGYVVSEPTMEQLAPVDQDDPMYQTVFKIRNAEPIAGVVRIQWTEEQDFDSDGGDARARSLPVQLIDANSSYQIAIKSNRKPEEVTIQVPLSLNRQAIKLRVPSSDEEPMRISQPLPDISPVQWDPSSSNQVVIDDLDSGFSITGKPFQVQIPQFIMFFAQNALAATGMAEQGTDHGIPVENWGLTGEQWLRIQNKGFGRYRRTFVQVPSVSVRASDQFVFSAEFATDLPKTGTWELEYSVPSRIFVDQMIRAQVNSDSESHDEHSTRASKLTVDLIVQINDETIPIEMDLFELKSEVDATIGDITINTKNVNDRLISSLVRSVEQAQQTSDVSYWLNLGSFDIDDPHVIVRISNKNSLKHTFADAVRWTYIEDGE